MAFEFANNPAFSPANLLMLSGNILANPDFASGLGTGLQQLSTNVAAQQKEQQERQKQLQETAQMGNYLRQQMPGKDFSNFTPGMLSAATSSALDRQFSPAKPNIISVGKGLLYDVDNRKYITPPEGVQTSDVRRGLNPIWGKDKDGNLVIGTLGEDGSFQQTELPEGFQPQPGTSTVDLGTTVGVRNNKTGEIIRQVPKDIEGAEDQKLSAKNKADARAELASVKSMAEQVDTAVKDLIGDEDTGKKPDPGLSRVVGAFDGGWGSWTPNFTEAANRAQTKIDFLKGTAFVNGRQFLKGQGQITDFESKKAEAAFSRMNQAQSETDFIAAVKDFNDAVQAGVKKVEAAANGNWQGDGTTETANPTADDLVNKYRSKPNP